MFTYRTDWFDLTDEERRIRDLALEVAREEIAPRAAQHDAEGSFVRDSIDALAEAGLLGVSVPKEYGGMGGSSLATVLATEAVSAACGSTGMVFFFHNFAVHLIKFCGPESLRQKYLPGLAKNKLGGLTVNEAESFLLDQLQTTLDERDGHLVVNGTKRFVTSAGEADVYILQAQYANSPGFRHFAAVGQGYVAVDADSPGISTQPVYPTGLRGAANGSVIYDNVEVPKENVLGEGRWGIMQGLAIKEDMAVGPNVVAAGIAAAAVETTALHMRKQHGPPNTRNVQLLADMDSRLNALRFYNYTLSRSLDREFEPTTRILTETYILGGLDAPWICDMAIEIMGGASLMLNSPIQRYYRDARTSAFPVFPMEVRRLGAGMSLLLSYAMAEHSEQMTMPWEPDAQWAYHFFERRTLEPQYAAARPVLSREAAENLARSRGEEKVSLDTYMEQVMAALSLLERTPTAAAAGGPPGGRPGGPPGERR